MSLRVKHFYEFGPFRLDTVERLLLREAEPVPLTPKSFDLLLALVEQHGHIVEKQELMQTVWPDTFVEETNLTKNIFILRQALGEATNGQKYIGTVPKRGYRFVAEVREVEDGDSASTYKTPIDSIAVMPFVNASANPEVEYLSDGISESLINALSQLQRMKVIARSSSFKYKGKEVDPQEVARALGVEAILTGQVMHRGDGLSISVELVDARDNSHIWGEQYNRKAEDLLAVQAEISREITEKLRLRLTTGEQQQLARRETVNPQAYELLLKGRFYWNKGRTESRQKAIEYYQQAIVVDPTYALAYAELAKAYSTFGYRGIIDPKEAMPNAKAAAMRALEIDDTIAEAHAWLAYIKQCAWDGIGAEQEYKRAQELNPNYAEAHGLYAIYLSQMQRHELAIAEARRAKELDPLCPSVNISYFYTLRSARHYDQAVDHLKQMLELEQNIPLAHVLFGYIYAAKEQYQEAIAAYKEAMKLGIDNASVRIHLGYVYALAGQREQAQAIHSELQRTKEYVSPTELAILYVGLGKNEQAFRSLELAYSAHDLQLIYLGINPHFDPLRTDPRFQDLVRRVGLPQ